ncbi:hypothetical protein [Caballeronia sp. 15711]|uniref:hypothetical protein n=1 Tax=Caballeronia sp. 15711 TaxID=3391029 RepID=UPI0039E222F7
MTNFEMRRLTAAASANQEDAYLWRMFSQLYEERRIRWCDSADGWLVSIDHRHLATETSFDQAIRRAIERLESGKKRPKKESKRVVRI